jgi:TrmH family RNA methyltransferase
VHESITSVTNPRVKQLVKLRNRRERDASGVFLVEGFRELTRAVDSGLGVREIYVCPDLFLGSNEAALIERAVAGGAERVELGSQAFQKVSYRDRPEGLIGLADQFPATLDRLKPRSNPLILVVESIEKPGNLGTMLRTADAAAVDAVIVCEPTTDPFNPNVIRASLGCIFLVPLAISSTADALRWLVERGITTFAATPAASLPYWQADLRKPSAIAVGSEQYGLTETWLQEAGEKIRIPMGGQVDSLNAAMAAGVILFEAVRQRSTTEPAWRPVPET